MMAIRKTTLLTRSHDTPQSCYYSPAKRDMEIKLTSIDFSRQVTKGFLEVHGCKLWVANLLIVPHTLGILHVPVNFTYLH